MAERITYVTNDGVTIVGNWVTSPTTIGAAILLHQYPSTRQSWSDVQRILATRGIASVAIDLRGHGESIKGPDGIQLDYQVFKDEEHASSIHDVRGAYEWIQARGIERDRIVAVGASIGANLALNFLSEELCACGSGDQPGRGVSWREYVRECRIYLTASVCLDRFLGR